MTITRRDFMKSTGAAVLAAPFVSSPVSALNLSQPDEPLRVHLFSKHLQFLDYRGAGGIAAELGFDGLDLTVRPKGHVLPENVASDLPTAIEQIEKSGSSCQMITTAISDVNQAHDLAIIKCAAEQGVAFYRTNWYKYHDGMSMQESINTYKLQIKEIGEVNRQHDIIGCYQNHAGTGIGSSYWEVMQLLEAVDPAYFGVQYDIRHAMVEGGRSWPNGLRLLRACIKTIVLKDYKWEKGNGKWVLVNVPIGEGMVDFKSYFQLLKRYGLNPPASLHLEYPLGGAEKGQFEIDVDQQVVFDAMKKDLATVRQLWKEA